MGKSCSGVACTASNDEKEGLPVLPDTCPHSNGRELQADILWATVRDFSFHGTHMLVGQELLAKLGSPGYNFLFTY